MVVGVSIGIALSSAAGDADELLRQADLAMYAAKRPAMPKTHPRDRARDPEKVAVSSTGECNAVTSVLSPELNTAPESPDGRTPTAGRALTNGLFPAIARAAILR